jgi:pantetheine-phosphate adenylyltransferase
MDVDTEVALGGTFDPVHDGHRALFERAFERGRVTIGLTSDELAPRTRGEDRPIRSYEVRRSELEAELAGFVDVYDHAYTIRQLDEPTGIATEPQFDVLVVSEETKPGGMRINEIRRERGYGPIELDIVENVDAEDGAIISSTRIINGEIDEHGNLTPARDGWSAQSPDDD